MNPATQGNLDYDRLERPPEPAPWWLATHFRATIVSLLTKRFAA